MRSLVKILSVLILFTAPVVGQEAGDNVRALFKNPSSGVQSQLDSIFGVITPDLQFEAEGGAFIAKDALIDPEYLDDSRPNFFATSLGSGVAAVLFNLILDNTAGAATCTALGTLLPGDNEPGEADWQECVDSGSISTPVVFGIGVATGSVMWAGWPRWFAEWKPW